MNKEQRRAQLEAETSWQAERLRESREAIRNAPIVIPYDNGGGQTGIRKNPMYDAYESLFSSFVRGCVALDKYDEVETEVKQAEGTPLQLIINKRLQQNNVAENRTANA